MQMLLCMPGKILYRYHLEEFGTDFKQPVGKIIASNRPGVIGLYNATGKPIPYQAGGKAGICEDRGRIPLLRGMELTFGQEKVFVE